MPSRIRRNLGEILLVGLVAGQILVVGHQVRIESGGSRLQHWTAAVVAPVQHGAGAVFAAVTRPLDQFVALLGAEKENRLLDAESDRLRMENHFLRQKLLRFETRADLEAYSAGLQSAVLTARVIAHGPSRSAREVFLDRGRNQGVRPGMAVITTAGIAGKVEVVHDSTSMILLISDPEAGAGIVLGRSGELGVLRGTGRPTCRVEYVGRDVAVARGDPVFTSGLDGIFPRGLPVGRVVAVRPRAETQFVEVRPFADLDHISEVLVVLRAAREKLPDDVRAAFAKANALPEGGGGAEAIALETHADRVKEAYRATVASQGKKVGAPNYGTGVPDFRAVADPRRALRSAGKGDLQELR